MPGVNFDAAEDWAIENPDSFASAMLVSETCGTRVQISDAKNILSFSFDQDIHFMWNTGPAGIPKTEEEAGLHTPQKSSASTLRSFEPPTPTTPVA